MTARSIILVGNGTSVLDRARGREIDGFDLVGRFNAYHIKGFEGYVGERTDVWFNVLKASSVGERIRHCYQRVYLHTWQREAAKDQVVQSFAAVLHPRKFQKIDHSIIDEMVAYADEPDYRCWSTGALAIWLMLKEHERVTLTGFDWWEREQHHYGDEAARGGLHVPGVEKRFIDRLANDGRVRFLS